MDSLSQGQFKIALPAALSICIYVITQRKDIIILKLHFEKAFDKIGHKSMLKTLQPKGFGQTWLLMVIMSIIPTIKYC